MLETIPFTSESNPFGIAQATVNNHYKGIQDAG
jgi:hypothetical protein